MFNLYSVVFSDFAAPLRSSLRPRGWPRSFGGRHGSDLFKIF